MRRPRLLLRMVDPAEVYFQDQFGRPAPGQVLYRGAAQYGPDSGRSATSAETQDLIWRRRRTHDQPVTPVDDAVVALAADDLIRTARTTIRVDKSVVHARIVRFWRGDSVLDICGPEESRSVTRIPRRARPAVIEGCLHRALGRR